MRLVPTKAVHLLLINLHVYHRNNETAVVQFHYRCGSNCKPIDQAKQFMTPSDRECKTENNYIDCRPFFSEHVSSNSNIINWQCELYTKWWWCIYLSFIHFTQLLVKEMRLVELRTLIGILFQIIAPEYDKLPLNIFYTA